MAGACRRLVQILDERVSELRARVYFVYAVLIAANLGAWLWAVVVFRHVPMFLGNALVAYGFGLRHAVDADHIAAIDNVTRKLRQDGKRPVGVGFFFAVGHSSIVILAAAAIAEAAAAMAGRLAAFKSIGAVISTSVSAGFLFAIAAMNLLILRAVWITLRQVRAGGAYSEDHFDLLRNKRGLMARLFRPLFRLITESWHMFALGFLFGLGFETATEVAVLGMATTEAARGVSLSATMVFPALFTAGMALIDTTDGILMLGAYDWAFVKPIRKLYYNLAITLVSAVVAIFIGGTEVLGLIHIQLGISGALWNWVAALNLNNLGFAIMLVFVAVWVGSVIVYRWQRSQ